MAEQILYSTRKSIAIGLGVMLIGFGGFLMWASNTMIEGAVVAPGQIVVEVQQQAVQHIDGGLVSELYVREGADVAQGDPILRLDGSELKTNLSVIEVKAAESKARIERLRAEIAGLAKFSFSKGLLTDSKGVEGIQTILHNEQEIFSARKDVNQKKQALIHEQIRRTQSIVAGSRQQVRAVETQLKLTHDDLRQQELLKKQAYSSSTQVRALQREVARFEGELGRLTAAMAEANGTIASYKVDWLREQAALQEDAQNQLHEQTKYLTEVVENLDLLQTKIERLVLRAPMSGKVLMLTANTVGGVIPPGSQVASIIPAGRPLLAQVRVDQTQIDRVKLKQDVRLHFASFDKMSTPELHGTVQTVSADVLQSQVPSPSFYLVDVALTPSSEAVAIGLGLLPGMAVEAFIVTDERTPLSFFVKPLTDYWSYSMREK